MQLSYSRPQVVRRAPQVVPGPCAMDGCSGRRNRNMPDGQRQREALCNTSTGDGETESNASRQVDLTSKVVETSNVSRGIPNFPPTHSRHTRHVGLRSVEHSDTHRGHAPVYPSTLLVSTGPLPPERGRLSKTYTARKGDAVCRVPRNKPGMQGLSMPMTTAVSRKI